MANYTVVDVCCHANIINFDIINFNFIDDDNMNLLHFYVSSVQCTCL